MADTSLVFDILARDKTSKGLSSAQRRAVATFAVIGAAVGAFAIASVKSASAAEQSMGATSTVFGKYADQVIAKSDQAATAYGLSANEYRENANLIGALFKNQGVAADQLAGSTEGLIGKAADLSATFGGSTRDAVEALASAFKGEFDPLERYGISLKQSSINAYLAAHGQDKLTGAALKAAQQQATLALINEQSADAQGAFGKESDTLAHQQQVLAAQFENVKAKVGAGLLPILTTVGQFVNDTLVPAFASVADWMGKNSNATKILVGALGAAAAVVYGVSAAQRVAGAVMVVWSGITKAVTAVQWLLNAALTANPIGIVVLAIAALVGALVLLYQKNETVRKIIDAVWSGIKTAIGAVVDWFKGTAWPIIKTVAGYIGNYYKWLWGVISNVWDKIKGAIGAVYGWFKETIWPGIKWVIDRVVDHFKVMSTAVGIAWDGVKTAVGAVASWFKDTVWPKIKAVAGLIGGIWDTISGAAKAAFNGIANAWNNTVGSLTFGVPDWVPGIGGKGWDVPDIPLLANGGNITRSGLAIVGERGPELLSLGRGASVAPLTGGERGRGYGGVNVTVNFNVPIDSVSAGREIDKVLTKYARTTGARPGFL